FCFCFCFYFKANLSQWHVIFLNLKENICKLAINCELIMMLNNMQLKYPITIKKYKLNYFYFYFD
ncbi:hypothetical protein DVP83_03375, partial [Yersinia enterocolitica]|nr:hypothetical protein [Yersinia enterocolitica]